MSTTRTTSNRPAEQTGEATPSAAAVRSLQARVKAFADSGATTGAPHTYHR